jgi:hypothetical protein
MLALCWELQQLQPGGTPLGSLQDVALLCALCYIFFASGGAGTGTSAGTSLSEVDSASASRRHSSSSWREVDGDGAAASVFSVSCSIAAAPSSFTAASASASPAAVPTSPGSWRGGPKQRLIFVLGMGRTGTSYLATFLKCAKESMFSRHEPAPFYVHFAELAALGHEATYETRRAE